MANRSVTVHEPCPMCSKPDWCYWLPTEYGELLCCARTTTAQDSSVHGNDGKKYYVKKPRTAQGFCVYEPAEHKQHAYEAWCRENGKIPKALYSDVQGFVSESISPRKHIPTEEEVSDKIAEPERLDVVYRALLNLLILEEKDKKVLKAEWNEHFDSLVTKYQIKTIPPSDKIRFSLADNHAYFKQMRNYSRKRIMEMLIQKVGEPYGVPGFYINKYTKQWVFVDLSGLVFPIFDFEGRIIRLRVRDALPSYKGSFNGKDGVFNFSYTGEWLFTNEEKQVSVVWSVEKNIFLTELSDTFIPVGAKRTMGKYKNFSSCRRKEITPGSYGNAYLHGTRSGSLPSVYAEKDDNFYTVYFTEGEKKAIVAHELLKAPVICFPGVGFYNLMLNLCAENFDEKTASLDNSIIGYLKKSGTKIGVICYDADKESNKAVLNKEQEAIKQFVNAGLYMAIGDWNSNFGKGLDDIAIAGIRPNIHPVLIN